MKKTWKLVVTPRGTHTVVEVRRGVEGSRALLGELTLDADDVESALDELRNMTKATVVGVWTAAEKVLRGAGLAPPGMASAAAATADAMHVVLIKTLTKVFHIEVAS